MLGGIEIAGERESKLPKRPSIVEMYQGNGVMLDPDQWDSFKQYVCELEAIVAKL
jgi:hypothetical protein